MKCIIPIPVVVLAAAIGLLFLLMPLKSRPPMDSGALQDTAAEWLSYWTNSSRSIASRDPSRRSFRLPVTLADIDHAIAVVSRTEPKTILRIAGVLEAASFRSSREVVDAVIAELGEEGTSEAMRREISRQFRAEDVRKSLHYLRSSLLASTLGVSLFKSLCLSRLIDYKKTLEENSPPPAGS